jgi:hypothetical protein
LAGNGGEATQIGDRHEDRHARKQVHSTPILSRLPSPELFFADSKVFTTALMKKIAVLLALLLNAGLVGPHLPTLWHTLRSCFRSRSIGIRKASP